MVAVLGDENIIKHQCKESTVSVLLEDGGEAVTTFSVMGGKKRCVVTVRWGGKSLLRERLFIE